MNKKYYAVTILDAVSGGNPGLEEALKIIADRNPGPWEDGDMDAVICKDAIVFLFMDGEQFRLLVCVTDEPQIRPDIVTGFLRRKE